MIMICEFISLHHCHAICTNFSLNPKPHVKENINQHTQTRYSNKMIKLLVVLG